MVTIPFDYDEKSAGSIVPICINDIDPEGNRIHPALIELGVLTKSNPERAIEQRASSARRLLVLQGSALVLQVAVVLLATALAQAHVN